MLSYLFYKIVRSDIESYTIPDRFTLCIALLSAASFFIFPMPDIAIRIILAETAFLVSGLLCGMGDAKLFAALALLFGSGIFFIFFASFCLCGAYCALMVLFKKLRLKDRIAFAPFIASAALALAISPVLT